MISKECKIFRLYSKAKNILLEEETSYESYNITHCHFNNEHVICDIPHDIRKEYRLNLINLKKNVRMVWSWLSDCIVREDLLAEIKTQGFTGFQAFGVTIHNKMEQRIDDNRFFRLLITGWGGHARLDSGIKLLSRCPGCNRQLYSMYKYPRQLFDVEQWDGSDFFIIWPLPKYIFITERVASFFKQIELVDYRLININELPVYDFLDDIAPGRLSQYLPEELALKYGNDIGVY